MGLNTGARNDAYNTGERAAFRESLGTLLDSNREPLMLCVVGKLPVGDASIATLLRSRTQGGTAKVITIERDTRHGTYGVSDGIPSIADCLNSNLPFRCITKNLKHVVFYQLESINNVQRVKKSGSSANPASGRRGEIAANRFTKNNLRQQPRLCKVGIKLPGEEGLHTAPVISFSGEISQWHGFVATLMEVTREVPGLPLVLKCAYRINSEGRVLLQKIIIAGVSTTRSISGADFLASIESEISPVNTMASNSGRDSVIGRSEKGNILFVVRESASEWLGEVNDLIYVNPRRVVEFPLLLYSAMLEDGSSNTEISSIALRVRSRFQIPVSMIERLSHYENWVQQDAGIQETFSEMNAIQAGLLL